MAKLTYTATENGNQGFNGSVILQFNPASIKISQNNKFNPTPTTSNQTREEQLKQEGQITIDVDDVIFTGDLTRRRVQTLFGWLKPLPKPVIRGAKTDDCRIIHFTWGSLDFRCVIENLSVTYTRFKSDGTPIRAKVNIKMRSQPEQPSGTNPTSGGLVGRCSRIVSHGDNLASFAEQNYQTPDAWRAIAEVNGIDDPLRIQLGARVYLPNPDELDGEAPGA